MSKPEDVSIRNSNGNPAVRPTVGIAAIVSLLQIFGNAVGGFACEVLSTFYKYPVSVNLAGWIATMVTIPMELALFFVAIKYGWLKLE